VGGIGGCGDVWRDGGRAWAEWFRGCEGGEEKEVKERHGDNGRKC